MSGLTFGTKSKDYTPPTIDPDDIWIKGLLVGETKVRFLEPTDEWVTYREHYDPILRKSFPCTEDTKTCPGCTSNNERTKTRTRKYAFNALNDRGLLAVYKIGSKFREQLKSREQRAETLLDRDYLLIRTGTTKDNTAYAYEALDRSDLDYDGPVHDVQQILSNLYVQYLEALNGGEDAGGEDEGAHDVNVTKTDEAQTAQGWEEPSFSSQAGDTTPGNEEQAAKAAANGQAKEAYDPENPPEDWPLSKLKAYCDEHDIDFPLRASKNTLIPLVEEHLGVPAKV